MEKKVVFDFDETLVRINSFTYWVFFIWYFSFLKLDFRLFFHLSFLLFKRKIRKNISHETFKKEIISLELSAVYYEKFSIKLAPYFNQEVKAHLENHLIQQDQIVISSGAPEKYLKHFIQQFYPNTSLLVIGAKIENGRLNDNLKEKKVENLIACDFLKKSERIAILFTDSSHDLALARLAQSIYLISPKDDCRQLFLQEFGENINVIE